MFICVQAAAYVSKQLLYVSKQLLGHISQQIKISLHRWKAVDLGFHLALSYRDLKHPTGRQNFATVVGLTQCHMLGPFTFTFTLESEEFEKFEKVAGSLLDPDKH